jgi:hypothetical protein
MLVVRRPDLLRSQEEALTGRREPDARMAAMEQPQSRGESNGRKLAAKRRPCRHRSGDSRTSTAQAQHVLAVLADGEHHDAHGITTRGSRLVGIGRLVPPSRSAVGTPNAVTASAEKRNSARHDAAPLAALSHPHCDAGVSRHQGNGRPSRKKPPLGPEEGRSAAQTTLAAPSLTGRPPAPPMSVATQPGQTELTRMPSLRSSVASIRVSAFSAVLETA